MSSHHFVKEGQEPALLILDAISFRLAEPLLEWMPLVLTTEAVLDKVLSWGIKVDVVLAQQVKTESLKEKLLMQAPVKMISCQPEDNPFVVALHFLVDNKQKYVNVMVNPSEPMFATAQKFLDRVEIVFFDEQMQWSAIRSGAFEKWLPKGTEFHIRKSLDQQKIDFEGIEPHNLVFKTSTDGMVRINSEFSFWVGEQITHEK